MNAADRNPHFPEAQPGGAELREAILYRGCTPDDDPSPQQIELLRNMTGQQRLALAEALFWDARRTRAESIQREQQDWSKEQVEQELRKVMFAEAMRKTT